MYRADAGLIATSSRSMQPPRLHRPTTCQSALAALAEEATPPVAVAGGTDLCAQFNEGLQPSALVALNRVAELRTVSADATELRIGSGVTHGDGAAHPVIREMLPGFAAAWGCISNVRVRFWATIGGNLMARRTRYEMSILLQALDARLHFLDQTGAPLRLTPADIWAGRAPARGLLHHVAIPLRGRVRFHYDRTLRPVMTLATCLDDAGGRAVLATEYLRPMLLPVSPRPPARAAAADCLAHLPNDAADPVASRWYLQRAGEVLLRRALETMHDAP